MLRKTESLVSKVPDCGVYEAKILTVLGYMGLLKY